MTIRGEIGCTIYSFICLLAGTIEWQLLMLCCHTIAPRTCRENIGAGAICYLWGVVFVFIFNVWVGLNRLFLAASVDPSVALHSALLHRGSGLRGGDGWLCLA